MCCRSHMRRICRSPVNETLRTLFKTERRKLRSVFYSYKPYSTFFNTYPEFNRSSQRTLHNDRSQRSPAAPHTVARNYVCCQNASPLLSDVIHRTSLHSSEASVEFLLRNVYSNALAKALTALCYFEIGFHRFMNLE